jgi:hypothetical protein
MMFTVTACEEAAMNKNKESIDSRMILLFDESTAL